VNGHATTLERMADRIYYDGPNPVAGTPFALHYAGRMNATKWIMRKSADGTWWEKDEKLTTELHHRWATHNANAADDSTQRARNCAAMGGTSIEHDSVRLCLNPRGQMR
jgi:hypothetical protein